MESIRKKKRSAVPIPRRRINLNKRKWNKRHAQRLSKKQEREAFGHGFPAQFSRIELPYKIDIILDNNKIEEVEVTLVSDKNHNLCNVKCEDTRYEAQEQAYKLLSHNRGINVFILKQYDYAD